ncbi:thiamine pyrophosphokinase Thi80 [Gautieria morchelliformis]|nr:thiamine pyrophosphokinase Thi80 [Gautieria morchelliformis]
MVKSALIILNQPFKEAVFSLLWSSSSWRACADGGANRLYDLFPSEERRSECVDFPVNAGTTTRRYRFLPDLIKGDFDSIRDDVKAYYLAKGVNVVQAWDQDSTDLQKCLFSLFELESSLMEQYTVILLGGLSGRLDQTVHTLSLLHKLRQSREYVYAVTEENVGWVLDSGEHIIEIDLDKLGPTCGLLPVGIDETVLSTRGLEWDLTDTISSFSGLVSTSNHVISSEVWVKTSKPIWWCIELRS